MIVVASAVAVTLYLTWIHPAIAPLAPGLGLMLGSGVSGAWLYCYVLDGRLINSAMEVKTMFTLFLVSITGIYVILSIIGSRRYFNKYGWTKQPPKSFFNFGALIILSKYERILWLALVMILSGGYSVYYVFFYGVNE